MSFKNIMFKMPQGTPITQKVVDATSGGGPTTPFTSTNKVPSVMVVGWIPTIGDGNLSSAQLPLVTGKRISGFNTALSRYYVKLRGANASIGNYDAADIGKVTLALDSLYGLFSELESDIIALNDMRFDSMAYHGMLAQALWRDPNTARKNLANLITQHNNIVDRLKALPFIPGIPFIKDHLDWSRFIYKDDNLDKSAIILFRRSGYYRWETRSSDPNPGFLLLSDNTSGTGYSSISTALMAEDKFDIINNLLDSYLLDEDMLHIAAEIYHAYGLNESNYSLPYMPSNIEKFKLETKFDLDVIDSLRSADFHALYSPSTFNCCYGIGEDTEGHLVYSSGDATSLDNNFLVPCIGTPGTEHPNERTAIDTGAYRILFSYEDNPTEEAVDVMARYSHIYKHVNSSDKWSHVYGIKSEFLTAIRLWYLDTDETFTQITLGSWVDTNNDLPEDTFRIIGTYNCIPRMYRVNVPLESYFVGGITYNTKDIDNVGYLPNEYNVVYAAAYIFDKFMLSGSGKPKRDPKNKKEDQ